MSTASSTRHDAPADAVASSNAPDLERQFKSQLRQMRADAKANGVSMNELCREANVSRACPDRWNHSTPKTIRVFAGMQRILARKIAKKHAALVPADDVQ